MCSPAYALALLLLCGRALPGGAAPLAGAGPPAGHPSSPSSTQDRPAPSNDSPASSKDLLAATKGVPEVTGDLPPSSPKGPPPSVTLEDVALGEAVEIFGARSKRACGGWGRPLPIPPPCRNS